VDFATLAVIALIGIVGPLLATPARWHVPVVLGELLGGVVLGRTGIRYLHPDNPTFTFLADVGFALVMFVAGSHLPVRDPNLRGSLPGGAARAVAVGVLAVPVALGLSHLFGTGHAALYAVLLASSSAALILPVIQDIGLTGPRVVALLPQIAIADAACIVALPLVVDPGHAARAALGSLAVMASAAVLYIVLREFERNGRRRRVHKLSERRKFALELRINLLVLFALAAVATHTHVSIMLAGFSYGFAVAAIGEPRRLARQLFAITDGFLGPLFFVWLGATLDLRALGGHPSYIVLGLALGFGAIAVHAALRAVGQPLTLGALAAAQVGVPVAAATLGSRLGLLTAQEAAALMLGAVVTIAVATLAAALAARRVRN
jgi:Kef-type K+ transport system membrane component KefB